MKKINGKKSKLGKNVLAFIITTIFLLAISSSLVLINRKYLFIESFFKECNSNVSSYFINKLYSNNNFKNSMTDQRIKHLQYENNILRKSLKFKEDNSTYQMAEVINHTSKYFYNRVDISKGRIDGIKKGNLVVTDKGLIGFISKISKKMSEVKLLTSVNENNMISVVIENGDEKISGVLRKYDPIKKVFEITDIVGKKGSLNNLNVFLANYGDNLYSSVLIGSVISEKSSEYGLSKTVYVKQDINYNDLLFVAVVVDKWFIYQSF